MSVTVGQPMPWAYNCKISFPQRRTNPTTDRLLARKCCSASVLASSDRSRHGRTPDGIGRYWKMRPSIAFRRIRNRFPAARHWSSISNLSIEKQVCEAGDVRFEGSRIGNASATKCGSINVHCLHQGWKIVSHFCTNIVSTVQYVY